MHPLDSYRHLVHLAVPAPAAPRASPTREPDVVALAWLFAEHHRDAPDVELPTAHDLAHVPPARRAHLLRAILTLRDPSLGVPPPQILDAIQDHLANLSDSNPDPLVPLADILSVPDALFPSLASAALPPALERISFFRGDITRIASPELAIVNAANTRMLGCFQPSHLCVDNIIHAAAGPRVRLDCFRIMGTQNFKDTEVGEAIVTRAYSLPSGFIVHTAGPQLDRGTDPTPKDISGLRSAYVNCLDLAQAVGSISTVAFPCISTGLFAFPGDQASRIAIGSTLDWFVAHPDSTLRVVFVLFAATDASHYLAALSSLFPKLPPPLSLQRHFLIPDRVRDWVLDADAVIIHAGAGLSADAVNPKLGLPLDYNSRELFKKLYPALLRTTEMETLYHSIGYDFGDPLVKWAFYLAHGNKATNWGLTPIYTTLLAYAQSKSSYTVLTSNADRLFHQSGFDPSHCFNAQGSYAHIQCLTPCSPTSFFPAQPWYDRAAPFIDPNVMRLPADRMDLIPTCEQCGGEAFLHLRMGSAFLESPMEGMRERYEADVERMVDKARAERKVVVLIEFGVGFNTPGVVRVPSERLVRKYLGTVKLVRVNLTHPEIPPDLADDAVGLKMGAVEFFDSLGL